MALVCKDKIEVETSNGLCEVELYFGSITQIDRNDPVDVLVVSAFPGDYATTPTSVIGALWRDLRVKVKDLARDKEEDLRSFFSCWWSKVLPSSLRLPFKRILCFEGGFKRGTTPPSVIGEVFRSLVSLCQNNDIRAIMPLLASGDQGYSPTMMLGLIVDAAVHWMLIGLPLRSLRIVIYCRDPLQSDLDNNPLLLHFNNLKAKWLKELMKEKEEKKPPTSYDIYLSYAPADISLGKHVQAQLQKDETELRIFAKMQEINQEKSWQEEIYQVMVTCNRVITLLTPEFLKHTSCVEQYNIALCCGRVMKRDYLAPLYVTNIDQMPTYMCLIQYVDCRPNDAEKITLACHKFATMVSVPQPILAPQELETVNINTNVANYEVFISYCHADTHTATTLKSLLHSAFPKWRIFIDSADLQAGNAWQLTLYRSIESSKMVISIISPAYINSTVCQEEYNLAALLHTDNLYLTNLLPLVVSDVGELPAWCQAVEPIKNFDVSKPDAIAQLVPVLQEHVDAFDRGVTTGDVKSNLLLSKWRSEHVNQAMPFFPQLYKYSVFSKPIKYRRESTSDFEVDVFLSYDKEAEPLADYFIKVLAQFSNTITVSKPGEETSRLALLDKAKIIVPFISSAYLNTCEGFQELNISLCRHRAADHMIVIPILLEPLRPLPAFVHLLCYLFAFEDTCWQVSPCLRDEMVSARNASCLHRAAHCVAHFLANRSILKGQCKVLLSLEEIKRSLCALQENENQNLLNPIKLCSQRSDLSSKKRTADENIDTDASSGNGRKYTDSTLSCPQPKEHGPVHKHNSANLDKSVLSRIESEPGENHTKDLATEDTDTSSCFKNPPVTNKAEVSKASNASHNEPVENNDDSPLCIPGELKKQGKQNEHRELKMGKKQQVKEETPQSNTDEIGGSSETKVCDLV